jgi:hypothetical protein
MQRWQLEGRIVIWHQRALALAVALLGASFSTAQGADCSDFRYDFATFQDASAAADREESRYESITPAPRYDEALCRATKHEASTLIALQVSTRAECMADPSKFQETVAAMTDMLKHVGKMEALACAPGQ